LDLGKFSDSALVRIGEIEFELVERDVYRQAGLLDGLREEVIEIAAASRGWDSPEDLALFRRSFKIGPLYEARALALVRRAGRLVGLAGSVNDWTVEEGSIVHLCSLGLLPDVQARGILPALMLLLWEANLRDPVIESNFHQHRTFISAITQSPYILWFLSRIADIYPSPDRTAAEADEVAVARRVAARFDSHLALDEEGFILHGECEFRYRRIPYSLDRRLNRFCDRKLRYDEGDVFVVVGRVRPEKLETFCRQVETSCPDLVSHLRGATESRAEVEERLALREEM
jgi:hypothetical protein